MCERFPAVTPFSIRRERASEVFLLMRRLQIYNEHHKSGDKKKNVVRRPAGDDWF